ncbi:hypothetical protein COD13_28605 [Priestia megaterium]|uniref:hypothetical protein n=1 Tax=Priestia megaterium TaxID=1404 RepID=UPI000BF7CD00|nr:hypothetical protein [Priestia megaterium]PFP33161.1 hypothetical protein COK03_26665 [Priestia megaterium]PGR78251.1 hypothetical protein COC53_28035 [Priestia megaterium]PGT49918.1 hypothetical protein COD13_28605 [Priestia megaterium]
MDWSTILVIAIAILSHNFLSTRASVYWGAIIPVSFLAYCGWVLFTKHQILIDHPIKAPLAVLFVLSIFIVEWGVGRDSYKKKQEKELNKMKTRDI